MERIISIDGREVRFRASAAIPRLYRIRFGRDVLQDITRVRDALQKAREGQSPLTPEVLTLFENMAYIMAKHADPNIPGSPEEWMDGFEVFSIYEVFPEILELWADNNLTTAESKKKLMQLTGK